MSDMGNERIETVAFRGRIGEVIHTPQPDGRIFERYRRSPGVRLIIVSPDKKILITKEVRDEVKGVDLRLPGGKVRNSMDEYDELLASGADLTDAARAAAIQEAAEETGLVVRNLEHLTTAHAGATVEWDLYYFLVREYELHHAGQQLKEDEDIEVTWMGAAEVRKAIRESHMQEWRSVGVLLGLVLPQLEEKAN